MNVNVVLNVVGGGSGVTRTDSSGQERIYHTPRNDQSLERIGSGLHRLDSKGHEQDFHTPRASVVAHSASARSFESASSHSPANFASARRRAHGG